MTQRKAKPKRRVWTPSAARTGVNVKGKRPKFGGRVAPGTHSLRLDPGGRDHPAPFLIVVADDLGVGPRCGGDHIDSASSPAAGGAGVGDDVGQLAVEGRGQISRRN